MDKQTEDLNSKSKTTKILLIEDDLEYAGALKEMLAQLKDPAFDLEHTEQLSRGLARLIEGGFDMVLLDLNLPDSNGLDTFTRVHTQAPEVPIIVLTGLDDEKLATKTVHQGAQDYLIKGHINIGALTRVVRYGIERHQLWEEIHSLSLTDELTGLYNRRGFLTLTEHPLKLSKRTGKRLFLLFADVDKLKQINDTLGHHEGDQALRDAARILKETFREADIVARLGGDEFAVLAMETSENPSQTPAHRLQENIAIYNSKAKKSYDLHLSVGMLPYDPKNPCPLDELLDQADKLMYNQKQQRRGFSPVGKRNILKKY